MPDPQQVIALKRVCTLSSFWEFAARKPLEWEEI